MTLIKCLLRISPLTHRLHFFYCIAFTHINFLYVFFKVISDIQLLEKVFVLSGAKHVLHRHSNWKIKAQVLQSTSGDNAEAGLASRLPG